jgi:hypothetical protein
MVIVPYTLQVFDPLFVKPIMIGFNGNEMFLKFKF